MNNYTSGLVWVVCALALLFYFGLHQAHTQGAAECMQMVTKAGNYNQLSDRVTRRIGTRVVEVAGQPRWLAAVVIDHYDANLNKHTRTYECVFSGTNFTSGSFQDFDGDRADAIKALSTSNEDVSNWAK